MNASVPQHLYGYVKHTILRGLDRTHGFEPCVIFGVTSIPSRALRYIGSAVTSLPSISTCPPSGITSPAME